MRKVFTILALLMFGLMLRVDIISSPVGIAMAYPSYSEDLARIAQGAWFYDWGHNTYLNPNYVPMSRNGDDPNLSADYNGYVLLFNEPNSVEPYGHPISVNEGVSIYAAFRQEYPSVKWVVGNVIFWGTWNTWLKDFKNLCQSQGIPVPSYWGIHIYLDGTGYEDTYAEFTNSELIDLHDQLGGIFWITEFADIHGNIPMDDKLVQIFKSHDWIARWAYFTNRIEGSESWMQADWSDFQLFDWDTGKPTPVGIWYMNAMSIDKTFLPMIVN